MKSQYANSASGVMDCLADATVEIANNPHLSDEQKVVKVIELIGIVGDGLSLADLRGLIDQGLADCERAQVDGGMIQ